MKNQTRTLALAALLMIASQNAQGAPKFQIKAKSLSNQTALQTGTIQTRMTLNDGSNANVRFEAPTLSNSNDLVVKSLTHEPIDDSTLSLRRTLSHKTGEIQLDQQIRVAQIEGRTFRVVQVNRMENAQKQTETWSILNKSDDGRDVVRVQGFAERNPLWIHPLNVDAKDGQIIFHRLSADAKELKVVTSKNQEIVYRLADGERGQKKWVEARRQKLESNQMAQHLAHVDDVKLNRGRQLVPDSGATVNGIE